METPGVGLKTGIHLPILVCHRVWVSRELQECMNVFIVFFVVVVAVLIKVMMT